MVLLEGLEPSTDRLWVGDSNHWAIEAVVAGLRVELRTLRVWTVRSSQLSYPAISGRENRIRTCDPLVPNQVLYQAEPFPDSGAP